MSEHAESAPSREEVAVRLRALISSDAVRDEVSDWASAWVRALTPGGHDERVWEALNNLAMADLTSTDRPYLYTREDFEVWLATLLLPNLGGD